MASHYNVSVSRVYIYQGSSTGSVYRWANLEGVGWRRIRAGDGAAEILSTLTTARMNARKVDAFTDGNNEIFNVYG